VTHQLQTHTPGPWDYVASTEHHGPYVTSQFGNDIADCYTMSNVREPSIRNGGTSKPIHFMHEQADANARLIATAPELLESLQAVVAQINDYERVNNLSPSPGRTECWDCVARAKEVIAKATGATTKPGLGPSMSITGRSSTGDEGER